jgi:aldehyde dehydrogenase (NAD+)
MMSTSARRSSLVAVGGKNFWGGHWVPPAGEVFESRNPACVDELVGVFPRSGAAEVRQAVQAAQEAFPRWRRTSRVSRAECFYRLSKLIGDHLEELTDLVAFESGKVRNEARADVVEGLHMVQYVFSTGRMPFGSVVPSEIPGKESYVLRKPKGVVAVITPWNFPFAIPLWLMGPSLVEGNTVVFKPAEETPAVGQRLVELMEQAGFPPGTVNLVHGYGEEAGEALVRDPGVAVVAFTGSYETGARIKQICAADYRKLAVCEMGSKSAIIVLADARLDLALNAAILSAYKTTGQRCVSAGRLIVHEGIFDQFAQRFVELSQRIRFGDPFDERSFAGPLINEQAVRKYEYFNELARQEGAEVLLPGGRIDSEGRDRGYFVAPFVYKIDYRPNIRCIREEAFSPHVALIPFRTIEEAIQIYNDTDYGLALSVITEDYRVMRRFREECDFGVGYVNLPCIGAEVQLPFGGVKKSGTGFPSAAALYRAVTHEVSWTVNYSTEIRMPQGLKSQLE